jgi:hypothetical protein
MPTAVVQTYHAKPSHPTTPTIVASVLEQTEVGYDELVFGLPSKLDR